MKDVTSSIPKCPHGIYCPDGSGIAKYCTFCTEPPEITEEERLKILGKYNPWPSGKQVCPICGSKNIEYEDDYNFECNNCGFDAMTS
jgi:hypothetical protein